MPATPTLRPIKGTALPAPGGFTLVEGLIASAILALVASGTAIGLISSNRMMQQGGNSTRIDTLIDADINKLKNAADSYTYCTGAYTWDGSTCNSVGPQNERYYFPAATSGSDTAAVAFGTACSNGTMTNALRSAMNGGDATLALAAEATALGVTRSQVTLADATSHRLQVDYTAPSLGNPRRIQFIPIAAAWCP